MTKHYSSAFCFGPENSNWPGDVDNFQKTWHLLQKEVRLVSCVKPIKQAIFVRFSPKAREQKEKQLRFCHQSPELILLP